ncbi:hypothetical protein CEB3_c04180 [Peptococcaceae bacterium CEB3]|nr:hypothetical protein CEB3_c04180 [Peptococcaceae bacterium CEB3]
MSADQGKKSSPQAPVEKHDTAPWANIKKTKAVSNVAIPSEDDVEYAKEWVDLNQK